MGILGAPWSLVHMGVLAVLVYTLYGQGSGYAGVPAAGNALWAEVGGGIIFVALREFSGLHPILLLGMDDFIREMLF